MPPLAGTLARAAATRTASPAARSDFVPERSIVRARQRVEHDLLELARRASPNARCREIEDRGFALIETRRHGDEVRAVAHVVRTHATGAPKRVAGIRRERVPGARTVVSLACHALATDGGAPRGIRRGEDHRDRVARDVLVAMLVADTRRRAYVVRLRELPALFPPVGVDHARAGIAGPIAQPCDELAFRPPRRGRRRRWTWLRASGPRRVDGGGGSACYVGDHAQTPCHSESLAMPRMQENDFLRPDVRDARLSSIDPMSVLHEPLWNELAAQLRPFLLHRVSPSDVDDVLQDVFLRVQRGLSDLRDEERFTAWLFRIARSSVAEHCRARARHPLTPPIETDGAEVVDDAPVLACCVAAFVARLPALYCEALTLVELEERSMQDAADRGRRGMSWILGVATWPC